MATTEATSAPDTPAVGRTWRGGTTLRTGHQLFWWAEVALVVVLYAVYSLIRNASASGAPEAFANALRLIDWQGTLGLNQELAWQSWALQHEALIIAANYFYGTAYVLVTLGTLVWLYRRFPNSYPVWRTTLVVGTMLALVGFATFPLMPPRLLDLHDSAGWGFVDTMVDYPALWSFQSETMASISNQFAAMPSLHCGWAMWACAAMWPHLQAWWSRALAVAYPLATIAVVVITGNHFFLDAAGGALVMGIGFGVAMLTTRAGREGRNQRSATMDMARR
jgi:hypothetical protein